MKIRWTLALVALLASCSSTTPEPPKNATPTPAAEEEDAGKEEQNSSEESPSSKEKPTAKSTPKAGAAKSPTAKASPTPKASAVPKAAVTPKATATPQSPEAAPKAKPAAAPTPTATPAGAEVTLPEPGSLSPLFPPPPATTVPQVARLVGQDSSVSAGTDLRPEATKVRVQKIVAAQKAAQEAQGKKNNKALAEALNGALAALRQHALYLEYLQGTGAKDPLIKDAAQQHSKVCEQIVKAATLLKQQPGFAVVAHTYEADVLACGLRKNESQVAARAQEYLKKNGSTALGIRVRLIAAAEDLVHGAYRGVFGKLPELLDIPQTTLSRVGLLFLAAEVAERRGDARQAQARLQEALAALALALPKGQPPPPLVASAAERLSRLGGTGEPAPALLEALRTLNAPALARGYMERAALAVASRSPAQAAQRYAQLENLGPLSSEERIRLTLRIIDLHTRAPGYEALRTEWENLLRLTEGQKVKGLANWAEHTRRTLLKEAQARPTRENIDGILLIHDILRTRIPEYRANDVAETEILALLVRHREPALVLQRADRLAAETKSAETRKQTLLIAIRAREKVLGLKEVPDWRREVPKGLNKEGTKLYVKSLDDLESSTSAMDEKEFVAFQSAYVLFLAGEREEARRRLEKAVTLFPGSRHAARGAWFFVKSAQEGKDFSDMEKLARAADKAMLLPPEKGVPDFKTLVATALWEQGRTFAASRKPDEAVARFRACANEFPQSPKAVECRLGEASVAETQGRPAEALSAYEAVSKLSTTPSTIEEARWKVANLAEKGNEWMRAGNAYESYAKTYPQNGEKRKAWLLAARAFRKGGDLAKASDAFGMHLKGVSDREEKFQALKETASLHEERKSPKTALQFYEQGLELLKWLPRSSESDEEIRIRDRLADLHLQMENGNEQRRQLEKVAAATARTREGGALISKAKRLLGVQVYEQIRQQIENGTGFAAIIDSFDKGRRLVLAECEVPGNKQCAEAQFQTASVAYAVYKAFSTAPADVKSREPQQARPRIVGLKPQIHIYLQEARKGLDEKSGTNEELRKRVDELDENARKLP